MSSVSVEYASWLKKAQFKRRKKQSRSLNSTHRKEPKLSGTRSFRKLLSRLAVKKRKQRRINRIALRKVRLTSLGSEVRAIKRGRIWMHDL